MVPIPSAQIHMVTSKTFLRFCRFVFFKSFNQALIDFNVVQPVYVKINNMKNNEIDTKMIWYNAEVELKERNELKGHTIRISSLTVSFMLNKTIRSWRIWNMDDELFYAMIKSRNKSTQKSPFPAFCWYKTKCIP